jgi:hypothetical protein
MKKYKYYRISEILRNSGYSLIHTAILRNPEDISKKGAILKYYNGSNLELDLTETILGFQLPENRQWWMFINVEKIDMIQHITQYISSNRKISEHYIYFMCGQSTILNDIELEALCSRLRELGRYDILIKCLG